MKLLSKKQKKSPPSSFAPAPPLARARLTLAPLYAGAIHYQQPDGTDCDKHDAGAAELTTGGYAAKGALPSVQAPLTYAH